MTRDVGHGDRDEPSIGAEARWDDVASIEGIVAADGGAATLLGTSCFTGEGLIAAQLQAADGPAVQVDLTQHQPSWPEAAVSEFFGVGDFYPTLLSPSALDWCSANSFSNALEVVESQEWPGTTRLYYPPAFPSLYQEDQERQQPVGGSVHGENSPTDRLRIREEATMAAQARGPAPGHANCLPDLLGGPGRDQSGRTEPFPIQFALPSVDSATHDSLRSCLHLPLLQSPWQPMSLTSFPSGQQLDYFIDLYFSNFDLVRVLRRVGMVGFLC